MIAIGIQYLCGWAVATDRSSYDDPEWPPHPARVFMALAAAHFETHDDLTPEEREAERTALAWLEQRPPPAVYASAYQPREVVTAYVPVNDVEIAWRRGARAPSAAVVQDSLRVLPDRRPRQPRAFPRAILDEEVAWLMWADAEADPRTRAALGALCAKVTRIGHSSSLVQVWMDERGEAPGPTLLPSVTAPTTRLRVPAAGLMDELEALYPALRPSISTWAEYGPPLAADLPRTVFDPRLLMFRLVPGDSRFSRLALASTRQVIDYFRRAVISVTPEPVPEYISGHRVDGSPSGRPHAAFLPLAFVGHRHADGHVLGLGIALPRGLSGEERRYCARAVTTLVSRPGDGEPGRLVMGSLGRWRLEPISTGVPAVTLRAEVWTRRAAVWASVTPVVLDRFTHDEKEKRRIIADACEQVGLPRPAAVRTSHVSMLRGVPPSPAFGPLPSSTRRPTRPFTHVLLVFQGSQGAPMDVQGPVLVGAGRYRGYGLFCPLEPTGGSRV